jgi:platelet-activating factor acetylhydrolase
MPAIEMRKHEVEMRAEEVHEAIVAVRSLVASGHPPTTLLPAGRTPATAKMDWSSWKDAISVDEDVVLAGHSFGGATVVHSLRALPSASLDAVSHGVVLDPWVEPLPSSSVRDLPRALLAINSPGFTRWSGNFSTLSSLVSSASGPSGGLATLGGSVHTSFSDFPTLFPRLSRLSKGGPTIDPRRAIGICVDASVAFIEGRQSVLADGERVDRVSGDKAQLSEPGKLYVHVPPAL